MNELRLDQETITQLHDLMIESSDTETSLSSDHQEGLQNDDFMSSEDEVELNMLTKDQEFLLEIGNRIEEPLLQKQYLEKIKQSFREPSTPTQENYNLFEILKRHEKKTTLNSPCKI